MCIVLIDLDGEEKAFWSLIFVLWKSHSPALASTLAEWLGSNRGVKVFVFVVSVSGSDNELLRIFTSH